MNLDSLLSDLEKEKKISKMLTAAYLKILMNFFQILAIISFINIHFDSTFYNFVAVQRIFSGSFFNVISLDCLFTGFFILFNP